MTMRHRGQFAFAAPTLIVVITVMTFWPGLRGEFLNWDDGFLFTKNPDYRGLGRDQLRWMFTTILAGHYMPLTWFTLGVNYVLGGMDPWGYHLLALILHATNAVLFYFIATRLLAVVSHPGPPALDSDAQEHISVRAGALVAALVFAVHPLRVESVAWITERGTLVSSGFYLAATLAYLRAIAHPGPLRWRWWGVVSVASFSASLLAKGMVVTLPVTLLMLDIYPLSRWSGRWRAALREKLPYIVAALVGGTLVLYARMHGAEWSGLAKYGLDARLAFAGYSFWFYPSSLVWPIGLSPLYEAPAEAGPLQGRFLVSLVGFLVVTVILIVFRHRFPGGLAAWINSALVVAPVSGLAHSGSQLVSDRYSYLAGLGFALIAGYAVPWVVRLRSQGRIRSWVATAAMAGLCLAVVTLVFSAREQTGIWRDSETLWRWAVDLDPECATCHAGLGEAVLYASDGAGSRLDEAEAFLRRAMALNPKLASPRYTLGTLLLLRGRYPEAEASLKSYMDLAPGVPEAPARLALVYLVQDRPSEALPLLLWSQDLGGHPPRSVSRPTSGRDPAQVFEEAIVLLGNRVDDLEFLGRSLVGQGKIDSAVRALQRAKALAPEAPGPRIWLAKAYEQSGRPDLASDEVEALRRLDPGAANRLSVR